MNNGILVAVACVVLLLLAWYLYHYLLRIVVLLKGEQKNKKIKIAVFIVAVAIVVVAIRFIAYGLVILVHILALAGLTELANGIIKLTRKNKSKPILWNKLYASGIIPVMLTILILIYGFWNMQHVVETDYEVTTSKNIRKEGYEIAMVSDLHYPVSMNGNALKQYCEEISSKNPDLIVLCGDIVDERTNKEEMEEALSILGSMQSTYGIYYVYGNHDKARYSTDPLFTSQDLENTLTDNGIHVLEDSVIPVNDEFVIVGRADVGYGDASHRVDQEKLLEQVDRNDYILLLDHQPKDLKENAKLGIDLQLSGHTHGGQFWPAGIIGEWFGANEQNYGLRKNGDFISIVSSGIAGWGNPFKTAKCSEYVMITVKPQ